MPSIMIAVFVLYAAAFTQVLLLNPTWALLVAMIGFGIEYSFARKVKVILKAMRDVLLFKGENRSKAESMIREEVVMALPKASCFVVLVAFNSAMKVISVTSFLVYLVGFLVIPKGNYLMQIIPSVMLVSTLLAYAPFTRMLNQFALAHYEMLDTK